MGTITGGLAVVLVLATIADEGKPHTTNESFSSDKYGITCPLAANWDVVIRERDDLIFVARVPQRDPERPAAVGCELALAPESLDEYRTRIDANAERGRIPGELIRNELIEHEGAPRLITVTEFRPPFGGTWRETTVRRVAHRQMYVFKINLDLEDPSHAETMVAFESMIGEATFSPPDTGATRDANDDANRWIQNEFNFAIDLPEHWQPALAPSQLALLFANGPAFGIWSDNFLVIARPSARFDPDRLVLEIPELLQREEPGCEVLSCEVIDQPGVGKAVQTVVRTQRGSFSMTVLERRFQGGRFDYETKFTLESKRFDALAPELRRCLDSFSEEPGEVPVVRPGIAG
ncbi:hypothetical protein [Tautonia rosea]|uniref:hypothetical protein n=1 Tax=Tautonia rosea TaxID=2728037 RepID=UPI001474796E|nr:hypothetical protein [Tautonia rosea]